MLLKIISIAGFVSGALAGTATTTNYYDGLLGACGCGTVLDSYVFTAAGSQALFGSGSWCGSGCGNCYVLTSTGTAPSGQGTGGGAGKSIIVAITNLCPNDGNAQWCPNTGGTNQYGYSAHFDINNASGNGGWSALGWNNPIVNYQAVACPSPLPSLYSNPSTCECAMTSTGGSAPATTTSTTSKMTTTTTSTTSKATTTSTTTKATSTAGSSGGTAAHYAQCGGTGWTGATVCASPYTCTYSSAYYSQCL